MSGLSSPPNGLGYLISQQLVACGETVFDVPPVLASRVGLLGSGKSQKNDPNDARSIAIAALGSDRLRVVEPDDHVVVKTLHGSRSEATTPPTTPRPRSKWHLGGNTRHRLNLRGTRILNHAIHIAAVTQLRHDTNGRVCYQKKIAEGKTPKEAIRALKRRISYAVYKSLVSDAARIPAN